MKQGKKGHVIGDTTGLGSIRRNHSVRARSLPLQRATHRSGTATLNDIMHTGKDDEGPGRKNKTTFWRDSRRSNGIREFSYRRGLFALWRSLPAALAAILVISNSPHACFHIGGLAWWLCNTAFLFFWWSSVLCYFLSAPRNNLFFLSCL